MQVHESPLSDEFYQAPGTFADATAFTTWLMRRPKQIRPSMRTAWLVEW